MLSFTLKHFARKKSCERSFPSKPDKPRRHPEAWQDRWNSGESPKRDSGTSTVRTKHTRDAYETLCCFHQTRLFWGLSHPSCSLRSRVPRSEALALPPLTTPQNLSNPAKPPAETGAPAQLTSPRGEFLLPAALCCAVTYLYSFKVFKYGMVVCLFFTKAFKMK